MSSSTTTDTWVSNSSAFDPSQVDGGYTFLLYLSVVIAALVLTHSWASQWKKKYTSTRALTEVAAVALLCSSILVIAAQADGARPASAPPTPLPHSPPAIVPLTGAGDALGAVLVYDFFYLGVLNVVIQLCDLYVHALSPSAPLSLFHPYTLYLPRRYLFYSRFRAVCRITPALGLRIQVRPSPLISHPNTVHGPPPDHPAPAPEPLHIPPMVTCCSYCPRASPSPRPGLHLAVLCGPRISHPYTAPWPHPHPHPYRPGLHLAPLYPTHIQPLGLILTPTVTVQGYIWLCCVAPRFPTFVLVPAFFDTNSDLYTNAFDVSNRYVYAVPCPALPCHIYPHIQVRVCCALPCPALPCPALPCPALGET